MAEEEIKTIYHPTSGQSHALHGPNAQKVFERRFKPKGYKMIGADEPIPESKVPTPAATVVDKKDPKP